jgi:RNA ligase (TIGR02306 family)
MPLKELPLASKMDLSEGDDVTDILGVLKWEKQIPAQLQGQAKGSFPSFIQKTDQERVQNLIKDRSYFDGEWECTIKLDGSSMTIYTKDGDVGVCSRNLELKDNEDNQNNSFVRMAHELDYSKSLPAVAEMVGFDFAVQGELMGPGIQGNREKFDSLKFYIFDIFNITEQRYLLPNERVQVFNLLNGQNTNYHHVPYVTGCIDFSASDLNVDLFLDIAEQPSINHKYAEGVVFKHLSDSTKSFKAISNKFLLKED